MRNQGGKFPNQFIFQLHCLKRVDPNHGTTINWEKFIYCLGLTRFLPSITDHPSINICIMTGTSSEDELSEQELQRQIEELQRKKAEIKTKKALKFASRTSSPKSSISTVVSAPQTSKIEPKKFTKDKKPITSSFKNSFNDPPDPSLPEIPSTPPRRSRQSESSPLRTPGSKTNSPTIITSPTSPARIRFEIDKGLTGWDVSLERPPKGKKHSPFSSPKREGSNSTSPRKFIPTSTTDRRVQLSKKSASSPNRSELSFAEKLRLSKTNHDKFKKAMDDMMQKRRIGFSAVTNIGAPQPTISRAASKALAAAATSSSDIREPFTHLRLAKEPLLEFDFLKEQFDDAEIYDVSKVFAHVHPPNFDPPQVCNWVLIGVVARKNMPRDRISRDGKNKKSLTIILTDLKAFDLPVSITGPAFEKYWKVTEGSIVAILNPGVYKTNKKIFDPSDPVDKETETFGLFVEDASADSILSIGRSKDYGRCAAVTKKGTPCTHWVNMAKTTHCDYHAEKRIMKARAGRMEMNSVPQGFKTTTNGVFTGSRTVVMKSGQSQPDYANKTGLVDDPMMPKYSSTYGKIWRSSAAPLHAYDNAKSAFFSVGSLRGDRTPLSQAAREQKAKNLEKERLIREKLAQRPDGAQLRYYDNKGQEIQKDGSGEPSLQQQQKQQSEMMSAFRPEHVRRIGFNPTISLAMAESGVLSNSAGGTGDGSSSSSSSAAVLSSLLNKRASKDIDLSMNRKRRKVAPPSSKPDTTKSSSTTTVSRTVVSDSDSDDLEII